ncbi:MAG: hypothetical protein JOZ27_09645 [Caulobacteraceae bacterium]|nr:hypothetical protein [Caulobacteraceae bacterium]
MADTYTLNYGWTKPQVGADTNAWGPLINADFDGIDSTVYAVSLVANAAMPKSGGTFSGGIGAPSVTLSAAAGVVRDLIVNTGTLNRWICGVDGSAEAGSNAGSNFFINSYNDAGTLISTVLTINRATGAVTLSGALTVTGALSAGSGVVSTFNTRSGAVTLTGSDVTTALGYSLGAAAQAGTGTSGHVLGYLDGALTFSGAVNFTGGVTGATATSGDNSTTLATTAFVVARGMQASGQVVIAGSATLTQAQAGASILLSGSGSTITLPSTAATYLLSNVSTGDITLAFPTGSDFRTTLHSGEKVVLCGDGTGYWRLFGSSNLQDGRLTGRPINVQSGNYTLQASDYGGCVFFTANATLTIPASIPISTAFDVSADVGVTVSFSYGGTLRTVPANSTGTHSLVGPGDAYCHQKKSTEIWMRGDAT